MIVKPKGTYDLYGDQMKKWQYVSRVVDEVMERGRKAFYEMRRIAAENGAAGMSLEEINEEIRLAREGR